jgi:hypothetical protein
MMTLLYLNNNLPAGAHLAGSPTSEGVGAHVAKHRADALPNRSRRTYQCPS